MCEGGTEVSLEEVGAPNGTTFLVKNLFYNTPARKKFLRSTQSEAATISDMMERIALSHPNISFKFINNGQLRLHTTGDGRLKDVIYHIYGREIAMNLLEVSAEFGEFRVSGYIGKPIICRGNRNFESFFVNERYIKSPLLSKAIEDGYHGFLMQHKYPFVVLMLSLDGRLVDVNVHPNKMELRFSNAEAIYENLSMLVRRTLKNIEMIPDVAVQQVKKKQQDAPVMKEAPEPFEVKRKEKTQAANQNLTKAQTENPAQIQNQNEAGNNLQNQAGNQAQNQVGDQNQDQAYVQSKSNSLLERLLKENILYTSSKKNNLNATKNTSDTVQNESNNAGVSTANPTTEMQSIKAGVSAANQETEKEPIEAGNPATHPTTEKNSTDAANVGDENAPITGTQVTLADYETKFLTEETKEKHRIIGQLFDTYWLVEFSDRLYMIDQHAAHEKVLYEQMMQRFRQKEFTSQMISPPIVLSLSMQEEQLLVRYMDSFEKLGFVIEPFGGNAYTISAVPGNLYGLDAKSLCMELMDDLGSISQKDAPEMITEKLAQMSCKAAVKGNHHLSMAEIEQLMDDLLALENPYFCPHGRPVIIAMTKYEIEKKFKRIV